MFLFFKTKDLFSAVSVIIESVFLEVSEMESKEKHRIKLIPDDRLQILMCIMYDGGVEAECHLVRERTCQETKEVDVPFPLLPLQCHESRALVPPQAGQGKGRSEACSWGSLDFNYLRFFASVLSGIFFHSFFFSLILLEISCIADRKCWLYKC